MRSLNLDQLRAFVQVAERGSFTAAAKYLNLTQPAVTHQVQELERRFNVAVLNGKASDPCLHGETDVGRNPFGIGSEAGLEIRIHRKINSVTERSQVLQNVGARHRVVRTAPCPRVAGTGRGQGGKAEVLQHPRAAHIPGVWQDKAALLVEGTKSGAFFSNSAGHWNLIYE